MKSIFIFCVLFVANCATSHAQPTTFSATIPGFSHELRCVGKTSVNDTFVYASGDLASVANAQLLAEKFRQSASDDYRTGVASLSKPPVTRTVYVPAVVPVSPVLPSGYWVTPSTYHVDDFGRHWRYYRSSWIRYFP